MTVVITSKLRETLQDTWSKMKGDSVMVSLHSCRYLDQRAKKMIGFPKIAKWDEAVTFDFDEDHFISWFGVWSKDGVLWMVNRPTPAGSIVLTKGSFLTIIAKADITINTI